MTKKMHIIRHFGFVYASLCETEDQARANFSKRYPFIEAEGLPCEVLPNSISGRPCDLIIMDDITLDDMPTDPEAMRKAWDWFTTDLTKPKDKE